MAACKKGEQAYPQRVLLRHLQAAISQAAMHLGYDGAPDIGLHIVCQRFMADNKGTKDKLQKKLDERLRNYNAQWDKLNENQEMQKALQEMNAAEQKEEKQREKEELLTTPALTPEGFPGC